MGMYIFFDIVIFLVGVYFIDTFIIVLKTFKERYSRFVCSSLRIRDNLFGGVGCIGYGLFFFCILGERSIV